jgi:hypothetical protein
MVLLLALLSTPANAWGHHYLVTARALEKSDAASRLVRVESLDHLLAEPWKTHRGPLMP